MTDNYVERVAGEIADLALADEKVTRDEKIVQEIANILGSSSQTLEEAFLTAVRVRRAETRARKLLAERAGNPVKVQSQLLSDDEADSDNDDAEIAISSSEAPEAEKPQEPQSDEDAAFADVLNTLDEFLQTDDAEAETKPGITPSRPSRG